MSARAVVVVGGSLSGPVAALAARAADPDARIVLLERAKRLAPAPTGIAPLVSGERAPEAGAREAATALEAARVEARTGVEVQGIDAAASRVSLGRTKLAYDALVVATGVESALPDVPGLSGASNVACFRTVADAEAILHAKERGASRVAVLGGGYFGLEAADALALAGWEVTVVEQGPRVLPAFGDESSARAAEALAALGVRVRVNARPARAQRRAGRVAKLELARGAALATDLVIVAAGVRPRTELLARAGARLHAQGAVALDSTCASSMPSVFACGAGVAVPHAVTRAATWVPQAAVAERTARVAGTCAAGGFDRLAPVLGTAVLRVGDLVLGRTGLTRAEAFAFAGHRLRVTRATGWSRDRSMPGAAPLHVELLHDAETGELLGAEACGADGADKRLDVLATALAGGLPVWQLAQLELGCAPSVAPPDDPVVLAGRLAREGAS